MWCKTTTGAVSTTTELDDFDFEINKNRQRRSRGSRRRSKKKKLVVTTAVNDEPATTTTTTTTRREQMVVLLDAASTTTTTTTTVSFQDSVQVRMVPNVRTTANRAEMDARWYNDKEYLTMRKRHIRSILALEKCGGGCDPCDRVILKNVYGLNSTESLRLKKERILQCRVAVLYEQQEHQRIIMCHNDDNDDDDDDDDDRPKNDPESIASRSRDVSCSGVEEALVRGRDVAQDVANDNDRGADDDDDSDSSRAPPSSTMQLRSLLRPSLKRSKESGGSSFKKQVMLLTRLPLVQRRWTSSED